MKCKTFEGLVADWVAGRAPGERAAQMAQHAEACPRCAAVARQERGLRDLWRELPAIADPPDLWLRVSDRLATPAPRRALVPRPAWALGGAFALAALMWAMVRPGPSPVSGPGGLSLHEEQQVVKLVSDNQSASDVERDPLYAEMRDDRAAERAILIGYEGTR